MLYGKNKVSYTLLDSVGGIDYISLVRSLPDRFIRKGKATIKNLPQELRKKDGVYYKIAPGDTNEFSFFKVKQKIPTGWVRDYVIEVVGYYTGNGKGAESPEGVVTYKNDIRFIRSLGKEIVMEFESARDRNVGITLYDVTGRVIRKEVLKLSTGIQRYSIRDLPSGIYFIRVPDMKDKVHKVTVIR